MQLAESIATRSAPLGVRTTLASARRAIAVGHDAAAAQLTPDVVTLLRTEDGIEGMTSFIERRPAQCNGRQRSGGVVSRAATIAGPHQAP